MTDPATAPESAPSNELPHRALAVSKLGGLELALSTATDLPSLKGLAAQANAVQKLLHDLHAALEQQNELAEYRIRVARKIGKVLSEQVHRGGHGSNGHVVTSKRGGSSAPLPPEISRKQSSRYQALASIADDVVLAYFARARARQQLISFEGLRHAAGLLTRAASPRTAEIPHSARPPRPRSHPPTPAQFTGIRAPEVASDAPHEPPDPHGRATLATAQATASKLMEAVHRVSRDVHTHVVDAGSSTASTWPCDKDTVLVVCTAANPGAWLSKIVEERRNGRIQEAFILTLASPAEPWFTTFQADDWMVCFLKPVVPQAPQLLAYLGERQHGFWLVFQRLGTILRTPHF